METYAGQPITIPSMARIVSPFPYPSFIYIDGANNGNPNPQRDRRKDTAASAARGEDSIAQALDCKRTGGSIQRECINHVNLHCLESDNNPGSNKCDSLIS